MTTDILTRLREAKGPDRELDAEIAVFARWHPYGPEHWLNRSPEAAFSVLSVGRVNFSLPDETEPRGGWVVPSFTDSIDASVALVERMLPGWFWRCGSTPLFPKGWAFISRTDANNALPGDEFACSDGKAATPAIALLTALFTALQEKENTNAN